MIRRCALILTLCAASVAHAQSDPAIALRIPMDSLSMQLRSVPFVQSVADSAPVARVGQPRWCAPGARGKGVARTAVAATFVGGNLALYEYFRRAWWSGEKSPFFVNYDWDGPFRDQDKLGHMIGGYLLSEGGRELLQNACMSEKKATAWAVAYAALFQLQIEYWDGGQAKYGFSPPDILFNTIGQGLSLSHAFSPPMRAVMPTMSYRPTQALGNVRAGRIPGDLRPTVDYSGQTYWLSVDVDTLLRGRARELWPGLLRMSVGHTISDWINPATGEFIRARRRFMLSLDIDPLKLPGQAPWWVTIKKGLRHYHFPSPALEFTSGGVRGLAWHQ